MRQIWFPRVFMALAIGLGVMAGVSRADGPPPPITVPSTGPALEQPMPFGDPMVAGDMVPPGGPGGPEGPKKHRSFRECMHDYFTANIPILCWSHHNSVGCGNFKSEFVFIFGSCRSFYGEPCLQKPVPPTVPPGSWPGYGYGQQGSGDCRCP